MKISETMSIEDLLAIVFDEDDDYSWSSRSEARNAIIRKFNAAEQSVHPTAFGVCPHGVNLGNQACSACEPEKVEQCHF